MQCEHCNKTFVNKYTLARHMKTAKACLKIQRSMNLEIVEDFISCDKCSLKFRDKYRLKNHKCIAITNDENNTIEKLIDELKEKDKIIVDKDKVIGDKDKVIEKLAKKDTTTNNINNTVINFVPSMSIRNLSIQEITKRGKKYRLDFNKGTSILANFAVNSILNINGENIYCCTDKSRGRFKFINEEGRLIEDPECQYLFEKIFRGIDPLYKKYISTFEVEDVEEAEKNTKISEFSDPIEGRNTFVKNIRRKLPASLPSNTYNIEEEENNRIKHKLEMEHKENILESLTYGKVSKSLMELSEEELQNLDRKKGLIKFAVSLLTNNNKLLYNYDEETETFYYYTRDYDSMSNDLIRKTEESPDFIRNYVLSVIRDTFQEKILVDGFHSLPKYQLEYIMKLIIHTCDNYSECKPIVINMLEEMLESLKINMSEE